MLEVSHDVLSQLFFCDMFYDISWGIIQYLILQFLGKETIELYKTYYLWLERYFRLLVIVWLLLNVYRDDLSVTKSDNTNKTTNVIDKLNGISMNEKYRIYNEFTLRRKMIKYNTHNLIGTFKNEKIYNNICESNTYCAFNILLNNDL